MGEKGIGQGEKRERENDHRFGEGLYILLIMGAQD